MLLVMRLGDRERLGTGWMRAGAWLSPSPALMVVDGVTGSQRGSLSSGTWSAGR